MNEYAFQEKDIKRLASEVYDLHNKIYDIEKRISFNLKIQTFINGIFIIVIIILCLYIGGII